MADIPDNVDDIKKAIQSLSGATGELTAAVQGLLDKFPRIAQEAKGAFDLVESGAESAKREFDTLTSTGLKDFEKIKDIALDSKKYIETLFEGIKLKSSLDIDYSALKVGAEKTFGDIAKTAQGSIQTIVDFVDDNKIDLSKMFVAGFAANFAEKIFDKTGITEMESQVTDAAKTMLPSIIEFRGALDGVAGSGENIGSTLGGSLQSIADAAKDTSLPVKELQEAFNELSRAGVTYAELGKGSTLSVSAQNDAGAVSGLAAAMRIAKGTGLELSTVGKVINDNLRGLGRTADDVGNIFAALKLAQEGSKLSMDAVASTVTGEAENLRFYGTSVESLSGNFKGLVKALGEGRQMLAADLFRSTISSIGDMNIGLKAFLGMQSQIGKGRGAIGSALEVEQALADGKQDEIIKAVREQLEHFGGGQILTRKEALDTNQEQQYLMQRQLLGTLMPNIQGAGQQEAFLEALKTGNLEDTSRFMSPERLEKAQADISETGRERTKLEVGVSGGAINQLRAQEEEALGSLVSSYDKSARKLESSTDAIVGAINQYVKSLNLPGINKMQDVGRDEIISRADAGALPGLANRDALTSPAIQAQMGTLGRLDLTQPRIGAELGIDNRNDLNSAQNSANLQIPNRGQIPNLAVPRLNFTPLQYPTDNAIKVLGTPAADSTSPLGNSATATPGTGAQGPVSINKPAKSSEPHVVDAIIKLTLDGSSLKASISKLTGDQIKLSIANAVDYG